jgi:hypothetical protein
MYDNYNYPAGADNEQAPWNQVEIPEQEFDVTISQTLSKDTTVCTNDYIPGASGVDYEPDDEGGYCASGWHDPDDTSDTNWGKIYREEHYTPLDLIQMLSEKCKQELKELEELGSKDVPYYYKQKKRELEHLIDECSGWTDDETEVFES